MKERRLACERQGFAAGGEQSSGHGSVSNRRG
jgi:hypothetical protein